MKTVRKMFLAMPGLILFIALCLPGWAQSGSDQQSGSGQSWDASTNLQDQTGTANPTRVTESHREENGKTVDTQTLETKGINGETQVYGQTETETVKVNATTTRVTTRHFVTNTDGEKTLNSVTVEERRELPDGGENVVRTVSSPDVNGSLAVTRREIEKTVQTSPGVRSSDTTVLLPGPDGGLSPSTQTHEVDKQVQPGITEYTKSVALQDGNGNWQVNEIRQGTVEKSGSTETKRESVSRLNADGKMTLAERTISKQTSSDGEKREDVQKFSSSMGGTTAYPDGQMHLDRQVTKVTRSGPGGEQVTEEQVNQRSPSAPDEGLHPSQRVLDITRTDLQGIQQQTVTIESADPNGELGVVWVDTKKTASSGPAESEKKPAAQKPANEAPH